jgi:hypothetical protein
MLEWMIMKGQYPECWSSQTLTLCCSYLTALKGLMKMNTLFQMWWRKRVLSAWRPMWVLFNTPHCWQLYLLRCYWLWDSTDITLTIRDISCCVGLSWTIQRNIQFGQQLDTLNCTWVTANSLATAVTSGSCTHLVNVIKLNVPHNFLSFMYKVAEMSPWPCAEAHRFRQSVKF